MSLSGILDGNQYLAPIKMGNQYLDPWSNSYGSIPCPIEIHTDQYLDPLSVPKNMKIYMKIYYTKLDEALRGWYIKYSVLSIIDSGFINCKIIP